MRYLLDTDILVYWLKGDESIETQAISAGLDTLAISMIGKAELYYGAYNSNYQQKNLAALATLFNTLKTAPFGDASAKKFGELKASLKQSGNLILDADLMIAATALTFNLVVVTNNVKHFNRISDLTVPNWRNSIT